MEFPGAVFFVLLSFWVVRYLRFALNAISLIILTTVLLVFAEHGPSNYTPTIGKCNSLNIFQKRKEKNTYFSPMSSVAEHFAITHH